MKSCMNATRQLKKNYRGYLLAAFAEKKKKNNIATHNANHAL